MCTLTESQPGCLCTMGVMVWQSCSLSQRDRLFVRGSQLFPEPRASLLVEHCAKQTFAIMLEIQKQLSTRVAIDFILQDEKYIGQDRVDSNSMQNCDLEGCRMCNGEYLIN